MYLNEKNIRCTPVLLKNAETARSIWKSESSYLEDVKDVSYGKLKAILPILDPDFIAQTKLPPAERKNLLSKLTKATYEEVLARVRKIRQEYDPASLAIDLDQFYSDLHSINSCLEAVVIKQDLETLKLIRSHYPSNLINDIRMLLAALRSEDAFQKLEKSLPKEIRGLLRDENDVDMWLSNIVKALITLRRGTSNSRERVRQRIGVSKFGELSTLLKAVSNDEELERYKRERELLERIRNPAFT
jgi:hypothetical protein